MSGPQGLSQAKHDGGRSCRSQGTAWGLLRGGRRAGTPGPQGRGGSLSLAPTPERTPFLCGWGQGITQAHYPKKGTF